MKVKMSGSEDLVRLKKSLENLKRDVPALMNQHVAEEAEKINGEIKQLTPTVTELLQRSWHTDVPPDQKGPRYTAKIVNNTEYASYVEYGHRVVDKNGKTVGHVEERRMMRDGVQFYKEKQEKERHRRFMKRIQEKYFPD